MRIILKGERLSYVLDVPLPESPPTNAFEEVQKAYLKNMDDIKMAGCLMLASMSLELQKQHEDIDPYTLVCHLREIFYNLLFCKEGTSMDPSSSKNKRKRIYTKVKEGMAKKKNAKQTALKGNCFHYG